jgi:Tfp pilus assembly pilus retraction ATPase PilT
MELKERIRPLCALAISRAIYNASGLADGLILLTGIKGKGRSAQGAMVEELLDRRGDVMFCERGRGRYTRR